MANQKPGLLNSWKEIANYLARGVRTVQRWEKLGLPVRRLGPGSRAPVIADTAEIDHWIFNARVHDLPVSSMVEQTASRSFLRESIRQSRELREQMVRLRVSQRVAVKNLVRSIAALERACASAPVSDQAPSMIPETLLHLENHRLSDQNGLFSAGG